LKTIAFKYYPKKKVSIYFKRLQKPNLKLNGHNTFGNFRKGTGITQVLAIEIALEYKLLERLLFHFESGSFSFKFFFNMLCTHYFLIIKKKPVNFQGLKIFKQKHIRISKGHPF
jgi:hypothetical protein